MGIAKHPEPVVFDIVASMPKDTKPIRPLDAFERRGLAKLREESGKHVEKVNGQIRMLAPIYAGAACVHCHPQPGELLGAFSYKFDLGPPTPAKPQP